MPIGFLGIIVLAVIILLIGYALVNYFGSKAGEIYANIPEKQIEMPELYPSKVNVTATATALSGYIVDDTLVTSWSDPLMFDVEVNITSSEDMNVNVRVDAYGTSAFSPDSKSASLSEGVKKSINFNGIRLKPGWSGQVPVRVSVNTTSPNEAVGKGYADLGKVYLKLSDVGENGDFCSASFCSWKMAYDLTDFCAHDIRDMYYKEDGWSKPIYLYNDKGSTIRLTNSSDRWLIADGNVCKEKVSNEPIGAVPPGTWIFKFFDTCGTKKIRDFGELSVRLPFFVCPGDDDDEQDISDGATFILFSKGQTATSLASTWLCLSDDPEACGYEYGE